MSVLAACFLVVAPAGARADSPGELARYIATPDASYTWREVNSRRIGSAEVTELVLTSQTWRDIPWKTSSVARRNWACPPPGTARLRRSSTATTNTPAACSCPCCLTAAARPMSWWRPSSSAARRCRAVAAYLLWMGVKILLAKAPHAGPDLATLAEQAHAPSLRSVFMGGFLTNALNPKVAVFFLAFVPQFIAPDAENKALAFVLLGIIFNLNAIPVNSGWALAAAWMARRDSVRKGMHWLDRAAACMFIAFGLKLALSDNPSK